MSRRLALAAWLILLAFGGAAAAGAAEGELVVSAAASLREPFEAIAKRYQELHPGRTVRLGFGASSVLARQIEAGAPVDVLVSADERVLDGLEAQGLLAPGSRLLLAGNRLVVVKAAGLTAPLARAEDLLRPELRRIALPDASVPAGHYAREWLARRGLAQAVEAHSLRSEDVRAALAAVDAGHADAAIVYATDARVARTARVAFEVPAAEQPRIAYAAAVLAAARHAVLARDFMLFLAGEEAAGRLRAAGFAPPPEMP